MKTKTKYIQCACSSELISLEKWPDEDNQIYLSIWQRGYRDNNKLSFFERLRWCWQIFRKGQPFGDCIILNDDNTDEFIKALDELKNYEYEIY